jgi:glycerol dehydrogenase
VRSFVAGIGDALATWLEARAAFKSRALTLAGGTPTMAARALARLCYDTLLAHGVQAKWAVEQKCVTPSVEKVIEANVLLSGLGFESGGLATAHMIANTLPTLPECKELMHGEKVGFGIVCQLCLDEDTDVDEMNRIIDFEIAIGLPVTLAEVRLADATREKLQVIGQACEGRDSLCRNHVFPVTCASVLDAIFTADAIGRQRKALSHNQP